NSGTITPEATRWNINAPFGGFQGEFFFPSQGILFLLINCKDVITFPCNNNLTKPSLMQPFSEFLRDIGRVHGQWKLSDIYPFTKKCRFELFSSLLDHKAQEHLFHLIDTPLFQHGIELLMRNFEKVRQLFGVIKPEHVRYG